MSGHIVGVAVTDGAPVFELAVPCEVFGIDRGELADPWYDLRLCAAGPGPVRTTSGLRIDTPYGLDDLVRADTAIVAAVTRAVQLDPPRALVEALRRAHERGGRIVSICSGAYVLAAAGLLNGRRATTHWMNGDDFAHRFPDVEFDPVPLYIDEGDIITSAGTGSAIDVCLHIVRRDHGVAIANEVARRMVVPPQREGGQAQYQAPSPRLFTRPAGENALAPVLAWARDHLHEPLTVPRLARVAHLSERTFARRFRDALGITPLQWLLRQRVRLAQELLETTDETVEDIARRAGFGTAPTLRHHFGRIAGVSPQAYRKVFRCPDE
ncbi:helix-turn-helix domain-containing protein [Microbispora cellulosiformans]|uniref:Helix-turn-helix domain-containing protein n=1 Tax=Microbispora cellulosiformans TaxID=2614688 RepID=A0A5J5JWD5_9ACTN|nr:helix-turn-helix domain-containing protein [Microbispora cellulosiformans]KAA9375723.1 helix-turn-helix domain-containing protein [Microbispora cellulosiformans]